MERQYNGSESGFVPTKQKRQFASPERCNRQPARFGLLRIAIAVMSARSANAGFRYHHTNTQGPPNEQAGTAVSEQPSATRAIGSLPNKQGNCKMPNANQNNSNSQQNGKEQIDAAFASASAFPGGFQAIATAYGDYTKKSFEDTRSFVEKLSGVKSFDKAVEIQTEYAKTAYETFVTESQKIGALYGDLAKQSYQPFGGFIARMTSTNR
jgi:hypothetical protein